ncbi:hypothetical protein [Dehalobacterium formicoaceticum]|uniref:hypothetical protein n=1 Tax=Dehalobacterium formicoaceticum TaxID=51515 RepID=UPI0012FBCBF2|nr:hypothetical protein [Dehalobacterium formicoaceticum]
MGYYIGISKRFHIDFLFNIAFLAVFLKSSYNKRVGIYFAHPGKKLSGMDAPHYHQYKSSSFGLSNSLDFDQLFGDDQYTI